MPRPSLPPPMLITSDGLGMRLVRVQMAKATVVRFPYTRIINEGSSLMGLMC